MGALITIGVRLASLVAIAQYSHWTISLILFFLLWITGKPENLHNLYSGYAHFRFVLEIGTVIGGIACANTVWGPAWAVGMLVIYVIGLGTH